MKRILVFLGLKVVEIGAVVFIPYWVGRFICGICPKFKTIGAPYWLEGIFALAFFGAGVIAVVIAISIVLNNWEWAGKITRRDR